MNNITQNVRCARAVGNPELGKGVPSYPLLFDPQVHNLIDSFLFYTCRRLVGCWPQFQLIRHLMQFRHSTKQGIRVLRSLVLLKR